MAYLSFIERYGLEKGIEQGREEGKLEVIKQLLEGGVDPDYLQRITRFSSEKIETLAKQLKLTSVNNS